ncbi:hypothetical protein KOR42_02980 [Thalassoglobus neptunius]|uniref:Uncharacterized protein n=1 Tax=Thalassoglobus neptunius TaxID=1938619 RepID=A0A5C5X478_9PLAN|nr:hypothetical protein [Thalassoglobus neptunius]TWT56942.1 hypothetical protein KOR42_02980 [Thalassoglobus neptunius]
MLIFFQTLVLMVSTTTVPYSATHCQPAMYQLDNVETFNGENIELIDFQNTEDNFTELSGN